MPEVNETIIRMLQKYPADIAEIAVRAISLAAGQMPRSAVTEQLEGAIRQAARSSEKKE